MADQTSTLAKVDAFRVEVAAIAAVPSTPTSGSVFDNLAPNTVRRMGTYVNPDPDWAVRGISISDYSTLVADPKRHQVCMFGGEHGPSLETDVRAFNTLTGAWSSLYPSTRLADMTSANLDTGRGRWINTNQPQARHTYNLLVVRGDELFLLTVTSGYGKMCRYNLSSTADPTTRWTFSQFAPPWLGFGGGVVDPVSNNIYVFSENSGYYGCMWKYDPGTDIATAGPGFGGNTQPNDAVYCPLDDRFYTFENNGVVHRCSINRANLAASTAQLVATTGPRPIQTAPSFGYPCFAWDAKRQKFGGCFVGGKHYEFDPVSATWSATTMLLEAGNTALPSTDFFAADLCSDIGCYVAVQNHPQAGPTTWVYRP